MYIALFIDEKSLEREVSEKSLILFEESLNQLNYQYKIIRRPSMCDDFLKSYKQYDAAIPVIHGGYGEGGQITALFELLKIPYLFSNHDVHALCFNKYMTNLVVDNLGFLIPETRHIQSLSELETIDFSGPFFVKPNTSGSSLDCGKFDDLKHAKDLVKKILNYDTVCIQKAIVGREFTVSLTGDSTLPNVLGIMEIITQKEFFDYDAKYKREQTKEIFPDLPEKLKNTIETTSTMIYKKCNLKDVARIDYLYANDKLYFLEINTIPGMTPMSFYPQCVKYAGYNSFAEFLNGLLKGINIKK